MKYKWIMYIYNPTNEVEVVKYSSEEFEQANKDYESMRNDSKYEIITVILDSYGDGLFIAKAVSGICELLTQHLGSVAYFTRADKCIDDKSCINFTLRLRENDFLKSYRIKPNKDFYTIFEYLLRKFELKYKYNIGKQSVRISRSNEV